MILALGWLRQKNQSHLPLQVQGSRLDHLETLSQKGRGVLNLKGVRCGFFLTKQNLKKQDSVKI